MSPVYGFVMPFVCCKSNGGEYDDTAFIAGAEFGAHHAALQSQPAEWSAYVPPAMVAQYDLLAMKEGYVMEQQPWFEHPDEWVLIVLRRDVQEDTGTERVE